MKKSKAKSNYIYYFIYTYIYIYIYIYITFPFLFLIKKLRYSKNAAKFMGIPIEIPAALKPNVNVSRGASFAVADATLLGAPVESVSPKCT